jgi:tetratricopeptide (TPR) repeat protein
VGEPAAGGRRPRVAGAVAGEPGIGKTRLADELAARAASLGAGVRWGTCWEGEGAPAFWPWIQALREHAARRDPATLRRELGDGAADVARLVPGLAAGAGELPPSPALEPDQARFRLCDAVAGLLRRAGETEPLLLVLDDLHWADRSSLSLLRFVARELRNARLLVLGTYRDVELGRSPAAEPLAKLAGHARHLTLGGLGQDDVAELLALTAGTRPDADLAVAVHRRTGGNPLFVREVARLLATEDQAAIPEGVREVLRRRLDRLPAGGADLLAVAAVLGQEFRLDLLGVVAGVPAEAQLALLDRAVQARLVERSPAAVAGYRFTHALLREVLYERLPAADRAALHRRAGAAVEERFAADLEPRLAELAHHFRQAAAAGGQRKAVRYASLAGRRAMEQLAYGEAAAQFERALEALDLAPADPARRCELELALGEAQMAAGEIAAARASYQRAAGLARSIGAAEPLATAALGLGAEVTALVVDEPQVRLLEEALVALGGDDGVPRARVLARLARALVFTPALHRRAALSEQAVAMARRLGDPATLAAVLYDRHLAVWGPDNPADRLAIAGEVVELAERCGDRALALQGRGLRTADLLELGDPAALRAEIEAYERAATELRQLHYLWHVPLLRATQALLAGRFEEAERLAAEGLAVGQRAHDQAVGVYVPVVVAVVRWLQGRLPELEGAVRELVARYPAVPAWRGAGARAGAGRARGGGPRRARLAGRPRLRRPPPRPAVALQPGVAGHGLPAARRPAPRRGRLRAAAALRRAAGADHAAGGRLPRRRLPLPRHPGRGAGPLGGRRRPPGGGGGDQHPRWRGPLPGAQPLRARPGAARPGCPRRPRAGLRAARAGGRDRAGARPRPAGRAASAAGRGVPPGWRVLDDRLPRPGRAAAPHRRAWPPGPAARQPGPGMACAGPGRRGRRPRGARQRRRTGAGRAGQGRLPAAARRADRRAGGGRALGRSGAGGARQGGDRRPHRAARRRRRPRRA